MPFKTMTKEEYRALDTESFNARVDLVTRALQEDEETDSETLIKEAGIIEVETRRRKAANELRSQRAANVQNGAGQVVSSSTKATQSAPGSNSSDMYDTEEYQRAFMEYVCRGAELPTEYRANQFTATTDVGAVIPTTIYNRIIEKMETYGEIWPRVFKLNVQGGVDISVADFKPTATWVTEAKSSDDQKLSATQKISFKYHMLEIKLAQSLLTSVTTLQMFQQKFPEVAAKAIVKALETAIVNGNGSGQMQGITTDSRVPSGNKIEMAVADMTSWSAWHKKVKAKMAKAYRNGVFVMSQATWDSYIDGMVDQNGQPVGRVNYGINGEEMYRFMGKEVITVEPDLLPDYDEQNSVKSQIFAMFVNFNEYAVNTNMQLRNVQWTDEDKNVIKYKSQLIVDGKLMDPNGVLLLTTPSA